MGGVLGVKLDIMVMIWHHPFHTILTQWTTIRLFTAFRTSNLILKTQTDFTRSLTKFESSSASMVVSDSILNFKYTVSHVNTINMLTEAASHSRQIKKNGPQYQPFIYPEDGSCTLLRNVEIYLPDYMVWHPRRSIGIETCFGISFTPLACSKKDSFSSVSNWPAIRLYYRRQRSPVTSPVWPRGFQEI